MSICLCYHDEQNFLHERGVCYGTKEKEPCSCGGNPVKCDFYEEVRKKYIHRTKADRIRSMTDEELAGILAMQSVVSPPWCAENYDCPYAEQDPVRCDLCALDWLKQEANDAT